MRKLFYEDEILLSWKKCIEEGIDYKIECPIRKINKEKLMYLFEECNKIIESFMEVSNLIMDLIDIPIALCLLDKNSILIKKNNDNT